MKNVTKNMIVNSIFSFEKNFVRILVPLMTMMDMNMVIVPRELSRQNLYGFRITNGKKINDIDSNPTPKKNMTIPVWKFWV